MAPTGGTRALPARPRALGRVVARCHYRARHEVGCQHPGALIDARRHAPGTVLEGDVGDRGTREPGGSLIVTPDTFMDTHRAIVIALAERHRLPAVYGVRHFVEDGGLISYGPDTLDIVRRSASYVDRVLRGERPGELPVQAPAKYELLINLKTAKALGLAVPTALRVRANEVIG
jgi:hypothetical protein